MHIDEDLLRSLKEEAQREGTSMAKLVNHVLRRGLAVSREARKTVRPYREKTFPMGPPKVPLDKALALAAALEDEEIQQKPSRRK